MGLDHIRSQGDTPRVMRGSFHAAAKWYSLRIDAKQGESRYATLNSLMEASDGVEFLGEFLPDPIVKGTQPAYVDGLPDGIAVISTLAIQNMAINLAVCRFVEAADYGENLTRLPRNGDVLLTVDGGTSIGKPAVFRLDGDFAVDSHVAILRPVGLEPDFLAFLLASPLGQAQFQRAESGASGQTSVTEDDIRRFRFPIPDVATRRAMLANMRHARDRAAALRREADDIESTGWEDFIKVATVPPQHTPG